MYYIIKIFIKKSIFNLDIDNDNTYNNITDNINIRGVYEYNSKQTHNSNDIREGIYRYSKWSI